jgi:hypothetical protein
MGLRGIARFGSVGPLAASNDLKPLACILVTRPS